VPSDAPTSRPAAPAAAANATAGATGEGTRPETEQVRVDFAAGANELDGAARGKLDEVANGLNQNPKLRLQLLAYAAGSGDAGSQARRLSLSRALSVRSYLIDKGVPSTRIDVRALGNKAEDGPPDRVDVVITQR
jgi:outer membrane protein OmpA-like peptidoglycan-associated protein